MKPRYQIISILPELFGDFFKYGVIGQAAEKGAFTWSTINPRQFTTDAHKSVDDRPFGGGDGMVMMGEPLAAAIDAAKANAPAAPVVYLSAQGEPFTAKLAREFATAGDFIFLCGRYGGVDQRLLNAKVDREISVGDFVVSGGEVPLMAVLDATVRFLPGVLGHKDSAAQDSFENGVLEAPLFTRPRELWGKGVPEVLLAGDHKKIARWRELVGWAVTLAKRPELLSIASLAPKDRAELEALLTKLTPEEKKDLGLL